MLSSGLLTCENRVYALAEVGCFAYRMRMTNADIFVKLMEEMIDLKIQEQAGVTLSVKPELKQLLEAKRHTDQQRLEEVRAELVRLINS